MGNTDSTQRLGERVLTAKTKLAQDKAIESQRYEYLKTNSPKTLDVMMKSIAASFSSFSPYLESTLLIAWSHDSEKCKKIVLDAVRKVLAAPIHKMEYQWFKQYVFSSSLWMFKTKQNKFMYLFLLDIAKDMSHDIIDSMDSIYQHLGSHPKWTQMMDIKNIVHISRQDHESVGLLQEEGLKDVFEAKSNKDDDEKDKAEDMKIFIDSNLAINILTSTATIINQEFQNHVSTVMSHYGEFKPGPTKRVERCVSKLENDYQEAKFPKCSKLLDLVRCSITFNTANQLMKGYDGLMKHINTNKSIIELARIKNGFLSSAQGGYRDIKVNVVYKSQINQGLNMICEIQLMLINYLQEKKRIHKLYSIVREEIYFQMVVQEEVSKKKDDNRGLKDLQFVDHLNVGKDVKMDYNVSQQGLAKCSVDPDTQLLGMEGIDWFGCVDMKTNKVIFEMKRDAPYNPWYGRQSHKWITIHNEKYLSVQIGKSEIKMFKVTQKQNKYSFNFTEDNKYQITLPNNGTINYCDFDRKFESILLITNFDTLEKRSMNNVNDITVSIKLQEKINQSSFRNLGLTDDGSICALGGGGYKNYFYVIDIDNKKQYKMSSSILSDTYAPCFINGKNEYISVSDKQGRVDIWDIKNQKSITTLKIGVSKWVTCSASTNNILAIASFDQILRLYDVSDWQCFYQKQFNYNPRSLQLTVDSQYLTLSGVGGDNCVVLKIQ